MFVIEKEYFLTAKKFLHLIIICFGVLFMVSEEVLKNERLKRNKNELKSNLALFDITIMNCNLQACPWESSHGMGWDSTHLYFPWESSMS